MTNEVGYMCIWRKVNIMSNKKSSYDKITVAPKRRKEFEEGYAEFCLQEELIRHMEEQNLTVSALARKADVSKTTVQMARKGNISKITLAKLKQILHTMNLNYEIILKRES